MDWGRDWSGIITAGARNLNMIDEMDLAGHSGQILHTPAAADAFVHSTLILLEGHTS